MVEPVTTLTQAGGERFASGEHKVRYGTVRQPVTEIVEQKLERMRSLPRVIKKGDLGTHGGDRFVNQVITAEDNSFLSVVAFIEYIPPGACSNKHGHMNEALFYILEGEGYDVHDGRRFDWQAGDVVCVPGGCVHRHVNKSQTEPVVALVINPKMLYLSLNLVQQKLLEPPFNPARAHEQALGADRPPSTGVDDGAA